MDTPVEGGATPRTTKASGISGLYWNDLGTGAVLQADTDTPSRIRAARYIQECIVFNPPFQIVTFV